MFRKESLQKPEEVFTFEEGIKVTKEEFCKRHNVHSVIRLHENLQELPQEGRFTHFNLGGPQHVGHKVGERYAIVHIIESGFDADGVKNNKGVILTESGIRFGRCLAVKSIESPRQIDEDDFLNSFATIRDVKQLKKALFDRYGMLYPELTIKEILDCGVTVTFLELERKRTYA